MACSVHKGQGSRGVIRAAEKCPKIFQCAILTRSDRHSVLQISYCCLRPFDVDDLSKVLAVTDIKFI